MEDSKEEKQNINHNGILSESEIYQKNKETNKNKIKIFSFLSNLTRVEIIVEKLQGYLYWLGLMEYFIWIVLLVLFFSDTKDMKKIWFFFFHLPRATVGLIVLFFLPKTHEAIDKIDNFDTNNLEEIQNNLKDEYSRILITREKRLKPLFIIYFSLTVISIVVDILFFCVISPDFGKKGTQSKFFVLVIAVLCFIFSDFVYLLFFSSFKYIFPPQTNEAIKKAVIGFFGQLKTGIANGFTTIARKFSKKPEQDQHVVNEPQSNNQNVNPIEVNQNVPIQNSNEQNIQNKIS